MTRPLRLLSLLLCGLATGCVAARPQTPSGIGLLQLRPSGPRPGAFAETRLSVYVDPAITEARTLRAVSLRDVELAALRSTLIGGLRAAFSDAFAEVVVVDTPRADGLLLRIDEVSPQHLKTGNVPLGGSAVVYEQRFDVRVRAALLSGEQVLTSVTRTVEGRDMSWQTDDVPLMLTHALEEAITAVADQLFADEALVRAGARGSSAVAAKAATRPDPKSSIAVMPLAAPGLSEKTRRVLDELLIVTVDTQGPYAVISTADIDALLGHEKVRDAMGCDDVACAAEIGGALGVEYLLTGSANELGSSFIVTLHLLNTRAQASVARGQATVKNDEDLYQQAVKLAVHELFAAVRAP